MKDRAVWWSITARADRWPLAMWCDDDEGEMFTVSWLWWYSWSKLSLLRVWKPAVVKVAARANHAVCWYELRTCRYDIFADMPIRRYWWLPICRYCRYFHMIGFHNNRYAKFKENIRCTHEVCMQTYSWGASAPLLWTCGCSTAVHNCHRPLYWSMDKK